MEINKLKIDKSWSKLLKDLIETLTFEGLINFLAEEIKEQQVYPPEKKIFAAFNRTPLNKLKVVIIGQDPYHGPGQANGLCFSVSDGIRKPPSLNNIFKELKTDLDIDIPDTGNLEPWADQGVLLLNATLTVRAKDAGSHQKKGWEEFTDGVIEKISDKKSGIVFLLWGKFAQTKAELIDGKKHHILIAAHPSPLARGAFFGSKHFSQTNEVLMSKGVTPIDWKIKDKGKLF
jgi:uracil-DNA glycosylase